MKKSPDYKLMFDQACAIIDCVGNVQYEGKDINKRVNSHFYVWISLTALACEIWMKCLITANGEEYERNHGLIDLWETYKKVKPNEAATVENDIERVIDHKEAGGFREWIRNASDAFVKWRYIFDYGDKDVKKVSPQFLRIFSASLRNLCCKEVYDKLWEEYMNQKNSMD